MQLDRVLHLARPMDEKALRNLKRAQIQQLARAANIKANRKTDLIVRQLLKKYPDGVPRSPIQTIKVDVKEETDQVVSPPLLRTPSPPKAPSPVRVPTAPPTPSPSPVQPTFHETHEMLRTMSKLIDATSLDPDHPTSIHYQAIALDRVIEEKILPRLMKVDKDVKDLVWTRVMLEQHCISQFKEPGVLLDEYLNKQVHNFGGEDLPPPTFDFSAKRKRDEELDEDSPPSPTPASKRSRTRVPS